MIHATPLSGILPACLVLLALVGVVPAQEEQPLRGCATMLEAQRRLQPPPPGRPFAARTAAASHSGRTMATPHFALNYSLAPTVHRIRWDSTSAADLVLKSVVDSIIQGLPSGYSSFRRDSSLHAKLDSMGSGHPRYITRAAELFERAWSHYDSLGMRMPDSSRSRVYLVPGQGRMAVDVADIGTADPAYPGAYYGLAYPPETSMSSVMLIENDFLYGASFNAVANRPVGTPVRSIVNGQTYRNYNVEWDMGLQVTIAHEFYHAVQYEYTPNLNNVHAWYELSAVGMEERLSPDVNDYFQYLPFAITSSHQISLFTPPPANANYGNGIFHMFLTKKLGPGFDVPIWERLATSNVLSTALVQEFGQAGWDSLYSAYTAALVLSGTPAAATSPLAFSPDMPLWPKPRFDTVPAQRGAQLSLPSHTFRLIRPSASGTGLANLVDFTGAIRVDSAAAGYQSTGLAGGDFAVTQAATGTRSTWVVANSSFGQTRQVLLSKSGFDTFASRNPVSRTLSPLFFLAPQGGSTDSLRITAESGRRVATLPADSSGAYWNWNLKDSQNRVVPPGLYFFGTPGQTPKPLKILP
jgi:hypothetical protein